MQHLPDGTVSVESIVLKVSSSSDDPNLKIILLSWSYQVNVRARSTDPQAHGHTRGGTRRLPALLMFAVIKERRPYFVCSGETKKQIKVIKKKKVSL